MRNVYVKSHVLYRWPERIGTSISDKYIVQMFRNNQYVVLEPAKQGRLIVKIKKYVFVISKSNTTITVHTVYGFADDYELKRPHAVGDFYHNAVDKWEKHQHFGKIRNGR